MTNEMPKTGILSRAVIKMVRMPSGQGQPLESRPSVDFPEEQEIEQEFIQIFHNDPSWRYDLTIKEKLWQDFYKKWLKSDRTQLDQSHFLYVKKHNERFIGFIIVLSLILMLLSPIKWIFPTSTNLMAPFVINLIGLATIGGIILSAHSIHVQAQQERTWFFEKIRNTAQKNHFESQEGALVQGDAYIDMATGGSQNGNLLNDWAIRAYCSEMLMSFAVPVSVIVAILSFNPDLVSMSNIVFLLILYALVYSGYYLYKITAEIAENDSGFVYDESFLNETVIENEFLNAKILTKEKKV